MEDKTSRDKTRCGGMVGLAWEGRGAALGVGGTQCVVRGGEAREGLHCGAITTSVTRWVERASAGGTVVAGAAGAVVTWSRSEYPAGMCRVSAGCRSSGRVKLPQDLGGPLLDISDIRVHAMPEIDIRTRRCESLRRAVCRSGQIYFGRQSPRGICVVASHTRAAAFKA